MNGLIYKDMINLKAQARVMVLLIVVYAVIAVSSGSTVMLCAMMSILSAMMPLTAMAYDEKSKWDKYAMTMPVSRRDLVLSKYWLGGGFLLLTFVINVVFNLIVGIMVTDEIFLVSLALLAAGVWFMSLTLPLVFKFGVEKGRTAMFILIALPTIVAVLFSKLNLPMPSESFWKMLPIVIAVTSVLVLVLSMLISISIYQKKEF
ncbi:ABC-2 transporter permease [Fusibacter bizertensis]